MPQFRTDKRIFHRIQLLLSLVVVVSFVADYVVRERRHAAEWQIATSERARVRATLAKAATPTDGPSILDPAGQTVFVVDLPMFTSNSIPVFYDGGDLVGAVRHWFRNRDIWANHIADRATLRCTKTGLSGDALVAVMVFNKVEVSYGDVWLASPPFGWIQKLDSQEQCREALKKLKKLPGPRQPVEFQY